MEKVCGHFRADQVQTKESTYYNNLRQSFSQIRIKPIRVIALFSLSLIFTLSSCMGKAVVDGEPALSGNDTINEKQENKVQNLHEMDSIKEEANTNKKSK